MAYLDNHGLETLWARCKACFGSKLGISSSNNVYTISLKGVSDEEDVVLSSVNLDASGFVNQNAFSNIAVSGQNTVSADSITDTLTLVAGTNVTLTTNATNDSVTITSKDTTYTPASETPSAIASSAAVGTSTKYAREDHVHNIVVATGDSNGQVKVAGQNASVKGLGSNAYTSTAYAPLASPALTGTPTAPTASAGTNTTQIATTAFVNNAFQANDAMVFKGTLGSDGTVASLPATHYQGWTYRVATAGTYAGQYCEVGDLVICVTDGTTATDSHWTVVQSNLDGAVTGPSTSTDEHVVIFDGSSGKVIKDSGFTIGKSVPANAVFTDNDTKNTAGSTDSSSKLFLIGATSQAANPQTYSQDTVYAGTDGHVYSNSKQAVNLSDSQALTNKTYNGLTLTASTTGFQIAGGTTSKTLTVPSDITLASAAGKSVDSSISDASTSTNLPTSQAVASFVEGKGYITSASDTITSWYGSSSTTASTAAKDVTCSGYVLNTGNFVAILFSTANTAAAPTLNINSTGAKSVYVGSAVASNANPCKWSANTVVYFSYDGTYYRYLGCSKDFGSSWYGTSNTASDTAAKVISCPNFVPVQGAMIAIQFSTANTAAAPTLNVNSVGAKSIYYQSAVVSATNPFTWDAGDMILFVYDGSYFRFIEKQTTAISDELINSICV